MTEERRRTIAGAWYDWKTEPAPEGRLLWGVHNDIVTLGFCKDDEWYVVVHHSIDEEITFWEGRIPQHWAYFYCPQAPNLAFEKDEGIE